MKTILVLTDFSKNGNNAVRYAVHLAVAIHADIKMMHAIKVPSESVFAAQVTWPLEDYASVTAEAKSLLNVLGETIRAEQTPERADAYQPEISYTVQTGEIADIIRNMASDHEIAMLVMGLSGAGALSRFFLGSNSREIIDKTELPLLLVPAEAAYKTVKKIAFATDLDPNDLQLIQQLTQLARPLNAEILITHITSERYENSRQVRDADKFLSEISSKINYNKIYYRHLNGFDIDKGLDWLCEHGQVNMIAMVHHSKGMIDRLFNNSHTQELARHVKIPLLVYNKNQ